MTNDIYKHKPSAKAVNIGEFKPDKKKNESYTGWELYHDIHNRLIIKHSDVVRGKEKVQYIVLSECTEHAIVSLQGLIRISSQCLVDLFQEHLDDDKKVE